MRLYRDYLKRGTDLLAVLVTCPVWLPVLGGVALAIRANMGGPVFFKQKRGGYRCAPILLYKFRTMTQATDAKGDLLPDKDRITTLGRILRATSLDELPSLLNVLKGQLSLVGPRPFIYEYMALYSDHQKRRHDLRPGITGWAQVNGRNTITWEEKFELDIWYTQNVTFWLDLKILFLTAKKVIIRENIDAAAHETMERWQGNSPKP